MEINNYPDYLIYSDGRVFSNKGKGRFLRPGTDCGGYHRVVLTENKKRKTMKVHRLVAQHYIPNPRNKPCVDHINRIRNDNRVENLCWATYLENGQNQGAAKNNTSGHKNISYSKSVNLWVFRQRVNKKMTQKYFKTLTEALVYKFCFILMRNKPEKIVCP